MPAGGDGRPAGQAAEAGPGLGAGDHHAGQEPADGGRLRVDARQAGVGFEIGPVSGRTARPVADEGGDGTTGRGHVRRWRLQGGVDGLVDAEDPPW